MRCRGGASPSRRRTGVRDRLSLKWQTPKVCHCEEAKGRRGALSAKREEVPLGCNLAVPGCIVGKLPAKSQLPSRDCHVASLLAMTRQGSAAMGTVRRTASAVLLPLRGRAGHAPPLQGQCGLNGGRRMIHSSFFIIHYFIHPPAGDGKPYDKTSGNSLPFVQISPEPPDLSLTTGAFIDKIISENKGAVCPLQQARQPAKNLFVTHDPNTRDQYRRTTQWIKNASLP